MTARGGGGERGQFIDCQRGGFSDMVQDSGRAEQTREGKTEDFVGGSVGADGDGFGREEFARAGFAGKFEPGIADLDGRRARDKWEHVGYGRVESGITVWIDFDEPARSGIFEGAIGIRVRCGAGLGADAENEYGVRGRGESVRVQVDLVGAEEGEAVF